MSGAYLVDVYLLEIRLFAKEVEGDKSLIASIAAPMSISSRTAITSWGVAIRSINRSIKRNLMASHRGLLRRIILGMSDRGLEICMVA